VKECVEGLLERNKNVYIVVDAIKGVDEKKGKKFLEYASSKGVIPVTTSSLV